MFSVQQLRSTGTLLATPPNTTYPSQEINVMAWGDQPRGVGASHGRVSFGALALLGKAAHGTSLGLRRDHGGLHLGKMTIGTKETLHTTETIGTRRHMAALKGKSKNSRQMKGKHMRTTSTLEETSLAPSVQQRKRSSSAIRQAHRSQKLAQPPGIVPH